MRDRLQTLHKQCPFGDFKYVLLDEADYIPEWSTILRGLMEQYVKLVDFLVNM